MYFQMVSSPSESVYLEQILYTLEGVVDVDRLQRAFQLLLNRHSILRTKIHAEDDSPIQIIEAVGLSMPNISCLGKDCDIGVFLEQDRANGMDVGIAPLFRVHLSGLHDEGKKSPYTEMIITIHHLIFDGWTLDILLDDLVALYDLGEGTTPAIRNEIVGFDEYVFWEEEQSRGTQQYWDSLVRDNGDFPLTISPTALHGNVATAVTKVVPSEVIQLLREKSTMTGLTPSVLFQTAWILAFTYPSKSRAVYGVMSSGRSTSNLPGIQSVCGPLVRMLPVFFDWRSEASFEDVARMLQTQLVQSMEHEYDLPYTGLKEMPAVFDFEPEVDERRASTFILRPNGIIDSIGFPLIYSRFVRQIKDINIGHF